jgi:predicted transcriptional regulator
MPSSDHDTSSSANLLRLTAQITAAYVGENRVAAAELPEVIKSIHSTMANAGVPAHTTTTLKPAVPIKRSVMPSYIVCLEDGRKLKTLKRHLRSAFNMTPDQYRQRWRLPADYPMVAPEYAERRSELAKQLGLGRKRVTRRLRRKR